MRMQVQRVLATGRAVLDRGITDLEVHVDANGTTTVYASSGRNGGISAWRIGSDGAAALQNFVVFPAAITRTVSDRIVIDTSGPAPRLLFGADGAGLMGHELHSNNVIGARANIGWTESGAGMRTGNAASIEAILTMTNRGGQYLPPWTPATQIVEVDRVTVAGSEFVLVASAATNTVASFRRDPGTGALIPTDEAGAMDGLGIRAPTAMETVVTGGQTFVVLAASGTSSLTVMRVGADGRLTPTDHVIDTASTRFAGVQALATAQVGGLTYVVAGGADHGISLFVLTPEGRLVFLQTIADTAALSMANVSAITAQVVDGAIHIFVGSQRDSGITHLTIPADQIGTYRAGNGSTAQTLTGTSRGDLLIARTNNDTLEGGAGNDVLISGPGRSVLRGGVGDDVFAIRNGTTRADILDFQRGVDRLDLSDLPMLRSVDQMTIVSTATGARITYRGVTVEVRSSDGRPLSVTDLFPGHALHGPDRIPILPGRLVPERGIDRHGTERADIMIGTAGNDTLRGGGGNDRITLSTGHNVVWGGAGNDTIRGGNGNDTLRGEDGNDVIWGWRGRNLLDGGAGNDTIYGGRDAETILGGAGDDRIWTGGGRNTVDGGDGVDIIRCGDGGNQAFGGAGNDLIYGGNGNDSLYGGDGSDRIWGTAGRNLIDGNAGNDLLYGGTGADTILGGPGDDRLYGLGGTDLLIGGAGNDSLWGGAGADIFAFAANHGTDRVMDFNPGDGDRLHLARALWASEGALTVAQLIQRFGSVDAEGNAVLDFSSVGGTTIILVGFDDLTALANLIDLV